MSYPDSSLLLNVADWLPRSRANGPGTRFVLWVQGCPFRCADCQNSDYLEFRLNHILPLETVWQRFQQTPGLDGISFSGGEPFAQAVALAELARRVQDSGSTVVCWTGYRLKQLHTGKIAGASNLLSHVDLLIDGLFDRTQADQVALRGSRNQKLHFLSGRISERSLENIPRQEWVVAPETLTYTGFPISGARVHER